MLGLDSLFDCFPFKASAIQDSNNADEHPSLEQVEVVGSEWLEVDEPGGFFVPKVERRRRRLLLDQVNHVLRDADCTRVVRLHDMSIVSSVEVVDSAGLPAWWMSILDPVQVQVWVVHFPTRERLQAWVSQLRAVVQATGSRAVVGDIVAMDNQQAEVASHTEVAVFEVQAAA